MEWILAISLTFVNGVDGHAEFVFDSKENCEQYVETVEGFRDGPAIALFGVEQFNVTCVPLNSVVEEKENEIDLW